MKFSNYHPLIGLIYYIMWIYFAVSTEHPLYMAVAFFSACCYLFMEKGKKAITVSALLIAVAVIYVVIYVSYNHFGVTVLCKNSIGNNITKEAIAYGLVRAVKYVTLINILILFVHTFSSEKLIYILGRACPRLSLFVAIFIRGFNQFKVKRTEVKASRHGIGKVSTGPLRNIRRICEEYHALISWVIENYMISSKSMLSRGYCLKGRSSYAIYRFDNRDRCMLVAVSSLAIFIILNQYLGYMKALYNPKIVIGATNTASVLLFVLYCILPILVDTYYAFKYKKTASMRKL